MKPDFELRLFKAVSAARENIRGGYRADVAVTNAARDFDVPGGTVGYFVGLAYEGQRLAFEQQTDR